VQVVLLDECEEVREEVREVVREVAAGPKPDLDMSL
jgi:hypothetical protein